MLLDDIVVTRREHLVEGKDDHRLHDPGLDLVDKDLARSREKGEVAGGEKREERAPKCPRDPAQKLDSQKAEVLGDINLGMITITVCLHTNLQVSRFDVVQKNKKLIKITNWNRQKRRFRQVGR